MSSISSPRETPAALRVDAYPRHWAGVAAGLAVSYLRAKGAGVTRSMIGNGIRVIAGSTRNSRLLCRDAVGILALLGGKLVTLSKLCSAEIQRPKDGLLRHLPRPSDTPSASH